MYVFQNMARKVQMTLKHFLICIYVHSGGCSVQLALSRADAPLQRYM